MKKLFNLFKFAKTLNVYVQRDKQTLLICAWNYHYIEFNFKKIKSYEELFSKIDLQTKIFIQKRIKLKINYIFMPDV